MTQEQSTLTKIKSAFSSEEIIFKHSILGYRIDAYFLKHKLADEVDEQGYQDRDIEYEAERQEIIKNELNCKFVRIIPAKENFNIFDEICRIHHHIVKSSEKLNKKSLIEKNSLRFLELEFKSNNSIKIKCLKWVVKKIFPKI